MLSLIEKTKSQRKTFTIPTYIVEELEDYAKNFGKKQSQIIAIALEEYLHRVSKKDKVTKRVNALNKLINIAPKGSLVDLDMDKIREIRALNG